MGFVIKSYESFHPIIRRQLYNWEKSHRTTVVLLLFLYNRSVAV